jgi:hypothetical protein
MALLYQEIMNVPGLTGTWQQRNAQYYKALGSPMGAYKGNLQQNLYLLDQIKKKNFPQAPAPAPQPAPQPVAPQQPLAQQYAAPAVQAAPTSPQFEQVLPFYDAWQGMVPQASQAAASQINPELMREYNEANRNYMMGMTGSGGERFGRALAGVGDLKAATERNRQAQMQDWLNQYQQGYKEMFYNPSRDAWNSAVTQGKTPDQSLKTIPTWNDLYDKYSSSYGVGQSTSPLYG